MLLAVAAWWRFDSSAVSVAPVAAGAIAADRVPSRFAAAEPQGSPVAVDPAVAAPIAEAQAVSAPVSALPEHAPESAPATSVPGRSLAELERRARAGDAKSARDWVDALVQCARLAYSQGPEPSRYLSHLDWALVGDRRIRQAEAHGPLSEECGQLFPVRDLAAGSAQAQSMIEEALRLWAATGDPLGQLAASTISLQWPPPAELWRQQQAWASAYLDPANPQTLVDLAQVFAYGSRFRAEAFRLAACDLGYDCSAGGSLQTRLCQTSEVCGSDAYAAELLQTLPPREWQMIDAQRRALAVMLQRGDTRGVFDLPPPAG